jgi:predicted Rossmann-fold nucleotide-binding protein
MTNAMNDFLAHFDERQVVGIMGGHGLLRTDEAYRQVVMVSKTLAENGCLMISGGGPGAMEATHLGAWMAGRTEAETEDALTMLKEAPSFKDRLWLETALQIMKKYPQELYVSLGVPTWLYGHEPATPFATHIAKYFDNSIREDSILTIAKGGIIYSPGSAGTMQEIFQEAVQNHYLSFGYASPMIFMNKRYWTEELPVYLLMEHLVKTGKYKNLLMTLTDSTDEIVKTILAFRNNHQP